MLDIKRGTNTSNDNFSIGVMIEQRPCLANHAVGIEVAFFNEFVCKQLLALRLKAVGLAVADAVVEEADELGSGGGGHHSLQGRHAGGAVDGDAAF